MLLLKGLEFTITGMLAVFMFLLLLVLLMEFTAFFTRKLAKFLPEEEAETDNDADEGERIAAIVTAVFSSARKL